MRNQTLTHLLTCIISAILLHATGARAADSLQREFRDPPQDARPWVYWFWSDGNVTKAGITADLEAMQRVGIGGVIWMAEGAELIHRRLTYG